MVITEQLTKVEFINYTIRNMKKLSIFAILLTMATGLNAQTPLDWHMQSFGPDSLWGAGINKAIQRLDGVKVKHRPVVAVISRGFDYEHEDLQDALWTNKKEIPGNGIDDDKNGYVDDVHGWNFLASADGKEVVYTSEVAHRMIGQLRQRMEEIYNKGYNRSDEESEEYMRIMRLGSKSKLETLWMTYFMQRKIAEGMEDLDRQLRAKYPDSDDFTYEQFVGIAPTDPKALNDSISGMPFHVTNMVWAFSPQTTWKTRFERRDDQWKESLKKYEEALARYVDERDFIKDNRADLSDCHYGNNNLLLGNSSVGTGLCGVIGATRGNDMGIDGICDAVQLMLLRAIPEGDEYDKDVAAAIQYAVQNGADIILLAGHKAMAEDEKILWQALDMAESKGILVVHGVGEEPDNMNQRPTSPSGLKADGTRYANFINVAASNADGYPLSQSNFGNKAVDLFAPGVSIYSCDAGDNYFKLTGTNASAAVVAGVAALIKSRYPQYTAAQLKQCLVTNAVLGKDFEVYEPFRKDQGQNTIRDAYYRDLCISGGLLDADASVQMAISGMTLPLEKARAQFKKDPLSVQNNLQYLQAVKQQKPIDKNELQEASNSLVLVSCFYHTMENAAKDSPSAKEFLQKAPTASELKAMKLSLSPLRKLQLQFLEASEKGDASAMINACKKIIMQPMPTDNMCDPVFLGNSLIYAIEHGTLKQAKDFVAYMKKVQPTLTDQGVLRQVAHAIDNGEGYIMLKEFENQ